MTQDENTVILEATKSRSRQRLAGLTRAGLTEEVARVTEISGEQAAVIVDAILGSMVRALQRGDKVEIRGFGSFHTRQRPARSGRNPKTGTRVEVDQHAAMHWNT